MRLLLHISQFRLLTIVGRTPFTRILSAMGSLNILHGKTQHRSIIYTDSTPATPPMSWFLAWNSLRDWLSNVMSWFKFRIFYYVCIGVYCNRHRFSTSKAGPCWMLEMSGSMWHNLFFYITCFSTSKMISDYQLLINLKISYLTNWVLF